MARGGGGGAGQRTVPSEAARILPSVKPLPGILHRAAVGLLELLLCSLPPRLAMDGAGWLGMLWFHLSRDRRRIACENVRIAFGDALDERQRRRIARLSFRHFGRAMGALTTLDRLHGLRGGPTRRIHYHGDHEAVRALARRGEAGLFVSAHFGCWEVGSYAIQHLRVPLRVVARTLDDPQLDAFITRRRGGEDRVIRKQGAVRGIMRTMREGTSVAFLADQNAGRHGVFVPFFGVPASTVPVPAVLNRRMGVPLVMAYCAERPGTRFEYDMHFERLPDAPAGLSEAEHIQDVMRRINAVIERWIRRSPTQYNWSHRRWKTRPVDEVPGPRTPAYGAKRPALRPRERAARRAATEAAPERASL